MWRRGRCFVFVVACIGVTAYFAFRSLGLRLAHPRCSSSENENHGDGLRRWRTRDRLISAAGFGAVMLLATFWWKEHGWVPEYDMLATQVLSVLHDMTGQERAVDSLAKEFYFIDVSNALSFRSDPDNPVAVDVITDRVKLGQLFELLNRYPYHRFIVCDILFDRESPQDSLLRAVLPEVPNVLAASIIERTDDRKRVLRRPIFDVDHGVAQVLTTNDLALRMRKKYAGGGYHILLATFRAVQASAFGRATETNPTTIALRVVLHRSGPPTRLWWQVSP